MTEFAGRGGLHSLSLRFVDDDLEEAYQLEEGAKGLSGYRIITAANIALWALAAVVLPLGTRIGRTYAGIACGAMALLGVLGLYLSKGAPTMNFQHMLVTVFTSANGLAILLIGDAGGIIEGYAVGAIFLLFLFGFVSRTRFVHALVRTLVVGIGVVAAAVLYSGRGSLGLDAFIYAAGGVASLLGLRMIERTRRQEWHQRHVIEEQPEALDAARKVSDRLLLNILPERISQRLKGGESPIADTYPEASVLFADIVDFTPLAARISAAETIALLSRLFSHFDDLVDEHGLEKIKTIGDCYLAVGGVPEPVADHARMVVDLARAMVAATGPDGLFPDLRLRVGVHSGPVAGGVIGSHRFAYDVWGDTVNTAARLQETSIPGRIHVSDATRALTHERVRYEPRGPVALKGLGEVATFLVAL